MESGGNTVDLQGMWQTPRPIVDWKIPSYLKNLDIEKASILMRSHKIFEKYRNTFKWISPTNSEKEI